MKVLVTGADGFAGRYLVRELVDRGHAVLAAIRPGGASPWPVAWPVTPVPFELLDSASVSAALAQPVDAIVHLAALASNAEARREPGAAWTLNAAGTARVAEAAAAQRDGGRGPRLLAVSSGEVYGAAEGLLAEDREPLPLSPYAASKLGAEIAVRAVARRTGLDVMIVRPFTHTGPGQLTTYFVPAMLERLRAAKRAGTRAIRVGNLAPVRDMIDVRDVVRAYALLLERGEPGATYNVARGEGIALSELFRRMARAVGVDAVPEPDPELLRAGDLPSLIGDPSRLRQATGWAPAISLDQTLADMLDAEAH